LKPEVGKVFYLDNTLMTVVDAGSFDQWLPVRPLQGDKVTQRTTVEVRRLIAEYEQKVTPTINAWAHSDDWNVTIGQPGRALPADKAHLAWAIDATPWFVQASDAHILTLVRAEWGGSREADAIGDYLAQLPAPIGDPRINDLLNYCETVSKYADMGWEFYVDAASAKAWLRRHRTHLLPAIAAIEASL
jgi:hypothetical protein